MAHFPTDIIADILSRLPVEPILRFRCVFKPWCALIDSPYFIKLHLKRSIDTRTNRQLILSIGGKLYSVNMHSLDVAVKIDHHPFLKKPEEFVHLIPQVAGSCDGLVLLRSGRRDNLAVWNPSTRIYQILPPPVTVIQTPEDGYILDYNGIGFDSVHNDYKVLNIIRFHGDDGATLHTDVQVFSLKTNSWRRAITDFPYYLNLDGCNGMLLASGALHWIASQTKDDDFEDDEYDHDRFIVAFDLATEEYRIVTMPSLDHKESVGFRMELAWLEGCLCISFAYSYGPCNVWIMKDYGVKESWTKLLSIPPHGYTDPFYFAVPMAFSKGGTEILLLQGRRDLIWYNLKHKALQKVNIRGLPPCYLAEFCVQSLVPLNVVVESNGKELHREVNKDGNPNKIEKKRDGVLSS